MGSQYHPNKETVVTRVIMIPIEVASSLLDEEIKYRQYLLKISGIIDIHFDATGEIEISYDVNEIEYDDILLELEKVGLPISYSLWGHVKSAWFQYVDTATRTKHGHHVASDFHHHRGDKHSSHRSNKH